MNANQNKLNTRELSLTKKTLTKQVEWDSPSCANNHSMKLFKIRRDINIGGRQFWDMQVCHAAVKRMNFREISSVVKHKGHLDHSFLDTLQESQTRSN